MFAASVTENPFAILTLIAAPAVFTNASSVLALGTGNRLALVVDRTRVIARELHDARVEDDRHQLWRDHLDRLERRGSLLLRALRLFYGSIGAFRRSKPGFGIRSQSCHLAISNAIRSICRHQLCSRSRGLCRFGDGLRNSGIRNAPGATVRV